MSEEETYEQAKRCAAIVLMELTDDNKAETLYNTTELLNGPLRGVMALRKFRRIQASGGGPPAIRAGPRPKARMLYRASDVQRWLESLINRAGGRSAAQPSPTQLHR